ncbi:hypothetical protein O181_083245 [Austropuccinia psidii MF-1]|uniref:Uncharacterized protein n=1 Tax=Austropuccinia psidii MF-1 TaxID=1389203 RepID=A0A9Q3FTD9_9BASI|nr:hypothetical protein [Austropuccinia psidii MF-1]
MGLVYLERAPPTPQRPVPVEHGTQELQPAFKLGRAKGKLPEDMSFKDLMEITKDWNPKRQFKLLEEREAKIRENQATIQTIEEQSSQKENIMTSLGSQGVGQPNFPVDSHHFESRKAGAKSDHYSQFQESSRRIQG